MGPCITVLIVDERGFGFARHFTDQSKDDFTRFISAAKSQIGISKTHSVYIAAGNGVSKGFGFNSYNELVTLFEDAGYKNVLFVRAPPGANQGALGRKPDGTVYYLTKNEPWELAPPIDKWAAAHDCVAIFRGLRNK